MRLRSWRPFSDVGLSPWDHNRKVQNDSRKRLICQRRGCSNQGRLFIEGRWGRHRFCVRHHRLQLEHERILERIRAL